MRLIHTHVRARARADWTYVAVLVLRWASVDFMVTACPLPGAKCN